MLIKSDIAAVIKDMEYREDGHTEYDACIKYLAHNMADMLAKDNPRFDRDRFLKACGVQHDG